MHRRKRSLKYLFYGLSTFIALTALIVYFPPNKSFSIYSFQISIMPLFFTALFLFLFSTGTYIFKSRIHGFLIALLFIIYLLFRQNDLTHPFFAVLLLALFLVLELLFTYRK